MFITKKSIESGFIEEYRAKTSYFSPASVFVLVIERLFN
ncbi:unnamed protein product [Paramecium sonneborni]|uniref:Uncharacterized protein n=1 Tax=Paramecium sonneborni TaxID=65129 RepID=A0A8S1M2J2_9CILI|nr:unnamed protein product [Paramecium sonneborni]